MSTLQTTILKHPDSATNNIQFDSSGRVGIGDSAPDFDLVIKGGSNTNENLFACKDSDGIKMMSVEQDSNGNGRVFVFDTSGNPDILLHTNGNSYFNGGNFGINTTLPQAQFVVSNSGEQGIEAGYSGGTSTNFIQAYDRSSNAFIQLDVVGNPLVFKTGSSAAEAARFDSSGRLGLGTSSPGCQTGGIHAVHDASEGTPSFTGGEVAIFQRNFNSAQGCHVGIIGGTTGTSSINFGDKDDADIGIIQYGHSDNTMRFFANAAERMRILDTGYLQAKGNVSNYHGFAGHQIAANRDDTMMLINNVTTSTTAVRGGLHIIYNQTAPNNTSFSPLAFDDSSANRFTLRSNGGIANYQSNDANLCDEREKKNIESLDSTWSCLKNWELKKFHYSEDSDTDNKRYGVIAQQVAPYCPELITDWLKQEAADAVLDDDGNVVTPAKEQILRMGVKEQQMMWMAIKALQEAQERIETLEAKVAALEAG